MSLADATLPSKRLHDRSCDKRQVEIAGGGENVATSHLHRPLFLECRRRIALVRGSSPRPDIGFEAFKGFQTNLLESVKDRGLSVRRFRRGWPLHIGSPGS
jgi:hypothetical protein